jgi:hypothetical protein
MVVTLKGGRVWLGSDARGATSSKLYFGYVTLGGFAMKLDSSRRQAAYVSALRANQVRVVRMIRAQGSRKLEARHVIAELRAHQNTSVNERQQIPVDGRSVQPRVRHAVGELGMADRRLDLGELLKQQDALLRDSQPTRREKLTQFIFTCGRLHFPMIALVAASRNPFVTGRPGM